MRSRRRVVTGPFQGRGCPAGPLRLLGVALLLLAACVSPEMRENTGSGTLTAARGAPDWVGTPLNWGKLERLGQWLQFEAGRYDPYWRVQAELTLGEGRLTFARREDGQSSPPSKTWLARLQAARSGLQKVVTDPAANEIQNGRARRALEEIDQLRGQVSVASNSATITGTLSRGQWRAKAPIPSRLDAAVGGYDRITIHHTANVPGVRFDGSLADSINTIQKVQRNHMQTESYGDIGYHFLIDSAGRVFAGRDMRYQGAHAGGANNRRNIGICLMGNFEHGSPSSSAMSTLNKMLVDLRRTHRIERTRIVGHGELKNTACPGRSLANWTKEYRRSGPALSQLGSSDARYMAKAVPASTAARTTASAGYRTPRGATRRTGSSSVVR